MTTNHLPYPSTFRIQHNGSDWMGTFQHVVREAVKALLQGGPIGVGVELIDENGNVVRRDVMITDLDGNFLVLDDGTRIDFCNDLLAIEVGEA